VKLAGVVVDAEHQQALLEIAAERGATAEQAGAADLLLYKSDRWKAYHLISTAVLAAIVRALKTKSQADNPLKDRATVLAGLTPLTAALGRQVLAHSGNLILCSRQRKAGQELARQLGCRYMQFDALYAISHDVFILCDEEKPPGAGSAAGVHPGFLKPGMTVLDLTAPVRRTPLLQSAADRGCLVVEPADLLLDELEAIARKITGKDVPRDLLEKALPEHLREERE